MDYWAHWPNISWEEAKLMKSKIDPDALKKMAWETRYPYPTIMREVVNDIKFGARLGVAHSYRVESHSTNAPSAYDFGDRVSDSLCKMMQDGYIMGPFDEVDIPFEANRFSGLMVKLKPDGSARLILNLSKGDPYSVNEGIDSSDFPSVMSSTTEFVRVLNRNGKGALMTKIDWASAYKQIRINHEDIWQQGFKWLGKTFYELCMVFGASSSAGLFDRLAKVILHIVLTKSGMPRRSVIQHLDDVCSASPRGSSRAKDFYDSFKTICKDLGVQLAPEGDKDKEFGPTTKGLVLGIVYDTINWTWSIKEDKLSIILNRIQDCEENESMTLREVKSLCGKLIDIRCLYPDFKFYLGNLIMDSTNSGTDMSIQVSLSKWSRLDLGWWFRTLPIVIGGTIPVIDLNPKPNAVKIFTDAAGGSTTTNDNGIGSCIFPGVWARLTHGSKTNNGLNAADGKSLAHKLSVWELVGPLLAISSAPDHVRNKQVSAFVDNMGAVRWWHKGWAKGCNLGNSIIRALHQVTKALNVDLYIHHVPRCSCREALVADAISKGDFRVFRTLMRGAERFPRRAPKSLEYWVKNPKPDRELGDKILQEMSISTRVLGFCNKRKTRWDT